MFFTYLKISKDSSAKYYQNNKERLEKKNLVKDIKVFLKKKKKKEWQNGLEQYKSLQEDEKQKLAEFRKKYYKMRKKSLIITVWNNHFTK